MTPAELAETMRPRVERIATTYRHRGVEVLPSLVDRAVGLAVTWATAAQDLGAELDDLDGATDLAGAALDTMCGAQVRWEHRRQAEPLHLAG